MSHEVFLFVNIFFRVMGGERTYSFEGNKSIKEVDIPSGFTKLAQMDLFLKNHLQA